MVAETMHRRRKGKVDAGVGAGFRFSGAIAEKRDAVVVWLRIMD